MKVLVAGSNGMLAQDLVPLLQQQGHDTHPLDRGRLDITDEKRVFDIVEQIKPDIVINCAAYNMVDQAEQEREAAFAVNAHGVKHLAMACRRFGAILCHISTDYVFNGRSRRPYRPGDATDPMNVYGESKRAGEVYVESILKRYYIIRTSSLYGKKGNNFVYTILGLAREKEILSVVADQRMSPTWTVNLAGGIVELIKSEDFGTYHLTDRTDGGITWLEFAKEILKAKGLNNRVEPVTAEEFARPARRPAYSVLDTTSLTSACGYEPMHRQDALGRFLDTI